jgi:tetratricopeptide (TPR) repeat protein
MTSAENNELSQALEHIRRGNTLEAQHSLVQAARAHPADPRPMLLLAAEYVHGKDIDRAEAAYIAALQRDPACAIARFQLGLLQLTCARVAAGQATWAPLDNLDENDPLRLFKRGLECVVRDDFAQARRWLVEGIAKNKENPPLNQDMYKVLERIGQLSTPVEDAPARDEASTAARTADEHADHLLVSAYRTMR